MNHLVRSYLKICQTKTLLNYDAELDFQVVVVGPQCSGKSTIIECLLEQFFLPHDNLPVHCPLIINVKYTDACASSFVFDDNWQNSYDTNQIEIEIRKRINKHQSAGCGVSMAPISLQLNCNNNVEMTVIEMPGIELQSEELCVDIVLEFKNMLNYYIANENTIILVVLPACKDLQLKYFKLLEMLKNYKSRTVIILTYLDCFAFTSDPNNLCREDFLNVFGVFCVPDKCFKGKRNIEDFRKVEQRFFRSKGVSNVLHGISQLSRIVTKFAKHRLQILVFKFLQDLKKCIHTLKSDLTCKEDKLDADKVILDEITRYVNLFNSLISGRNPDIETNSLVGGARISYVFREIFANSLDIINPLSGLNRPLILAAIRNTCGTRPEVLLLSEASFEILARRQIAQFKDPCHRCVELVYEEMLKLKTDCSSCLNTSNYPKFCDVLIKTTAELIDMRYNMCVELVDELLNMELAFINTFDADFEKNVVMNIAEWFFAQNPPIIINNTREEEENDPRLLSFGGSNWLSNLLSSKYTEKVDSQAVCQPSISPTSSNIKLLHITPKENADCQLLENLIVAYFSTVRRSLKDSIPKAIMLRMVNFVRENIYHILLECLRKEKSHITAFFAGIEEKRKEKISHLQLLCECNKTLEEIYDELQK